MQVKSAVGYLLIIAVALAGLSFMQQRADSTKDSVDQRVIDNGSIRIGYIMYPPLLERNSNTGELSGISYDIVEEAATRLGLETEWIEEVGWGSSIEGLKLGRYDILGTQMWPSAARAREAVFSKAPFYSDVYGYVKAGDTRFDNNLSQINEPEVTIGTLDGEMAQAIASTDYPDASVVALPQLSSFSEMILSVVNNKADITFAEPSVIQGFIEANPNTIQQVTSDPIRSFGNSFAFKRGENAMVAMWNTTLTEMINDGTVASILDTYGVTDVYRLNR